MIKNSQPFGKKFQKTAGGIFLTHTVQYITGIALNVAYYVSDSEASFNSVTKFYSSITFSTYRQADFSVKTQNDLFPKRCIASSAANRNEYLSFTLSEFAVTWVHSLQFLCKSAHFSGRCRRKCRVWSTAALRLPTLPVDVDDQPTCTA